MKLPIFPRDISIKYGSSKSMKWNTKVQRSGANKVRTLTNYRYPRWTITVKAIALTNEDVRRIQGFFASVRGGSQPFLWYDHEDNSEYSVTLGVGDGVTQDFYLVRTLGGFHEPIQDIVDNTLIVRVDDIDVEFELQDNGKVHLKNAPLQGQKVTAYYEYYWRVMLEKDEFKITNKFEDINETGNLTLGVVR